MKSYICYQDENGKPVYREATPEEMAAIQVSTTNPNWMHDYPLRIVAPKTLALDYPQFYVWFMLNELPMEKVGDNVHIYCNEIMPEHQSLIDSLNGVITIEKRNG